MKAQRDLPFQLPRPLGLVASSIRARESAQAVIKQAGSPRVAFHRPAAPPAQDDSHFVLMHMSLSLANLELAHWEVEARVKSTKAAIDNLPRQPRPEKAEDDEGEWAAAIAKDVCDLQITLDGLMAQQRSLAECILRKQLTQQT